MEPELCLCHRTQFILPVYSAASLSALRLLQAYPWAQSSPPEGLTRAGGPALVLCSSSLTYEALLWWRRDDEPVLGVFLRQLLIEPQEVTEPPLD